jgi:hypothetical protein
VLIVGRDVVGTGEPEPGTVVGAVVTADGGCSGSPLAVPLASEGPATVEPSAAPGDPGPAGSTPAPGAEMVLDVLTPAPELAAPGAATAEPTAT